MSKRLKNYPDPIEIINEYGSDCLRLYLLSSPASRGETLKFSKTGVHNVMKDIIIPLSNTIIFWKEYYQLYIKDNIFNFEMNNITNPINIWILIEYGKLRDKYNNLMETYHLKEAINCLYDVVEIMNNGYIKLGRNLLKGKVNNNEWLESLNTLYYIIKFIINDFKSIIPFFVEKEYLNLKSLILNDTYFESVSIHLKENINNYLIFNISNESSNFYINSNFNIANNFNLIYNIIWNIHKIRGTCNISLKKPIKEVTIISDSYINQNYLNFIFDECNILDIHIKKLNEVTIVKNIKPIKALFFKKYGKIINDTYNQIEKLNQTELDEIIKNNTYNNFDIDASLFNINYFNNEIKEFNINNDKILILLNKDYDDTLDMIYYYRLVATNIQKSRKSAGLHPWDTICVYYKNINSKYNLNSTEAIEYINKIIRVEFKEYESNINHFYNEEYNELGITIYFVKV
jgi:isoleucyl-tRNA synthetase